MKQQRAYMFFTIATLISVLLFSHQVKAQEVEDEREFDYIQGSEKGPEKWGELKKEWASCKNGTLQSPIDMSNQRVKIIPKSGDLKRNYRSCNSTVKNRGHDISLQWEGHKAGSVNINGTGYFLQQCHWHSPSEHTINGRRYDMELHMVHESTDPNVKNKIAVTGILYKIGQPDAFLSKLLGNVISMTDHKQDRNMGMINPNEIKMGGKRYYRYEGSLTVPPCTEGVIWTINKKIRTVSIDQVKALREAVHDYAEKNSRPVQPLNEREVQLYGAN
ncbi:carbonic anhydrase, putative [Ricinus communis]|uniref:Carbonic anhydrase n=1 Tax=Ricinus communis TaxID=3988 RepID=B9S0D9_RICCO|nr:carbonic anhydrase, putative [Ricinus communis]|eukprot:XP_002519458.1 alpha carbonic anhydrase 7 [Ricinus communis]